MKQARFHKWQKYRQLIPWHRIRVFIFRWCHHPKAPWFLAFVLMASMIFYQQTQIAELQNRIDASNNYSDKDSFSYRIYNLEYITDSHTRDIYNMKLEQEDMSKSIWYLQSKQNDLDWRIRMLEWKTPTTTTNP